MTEKSSWSFPRRPRRRAAQILFKNDGRRLIALGRSEKGRPWLARFDATTGKLLASEVLDQESAGDARALLQLPDCSFWLVSVLFLKKRRWK